MSMKNILTVTLNPSLDITMYAESFVFDEPNRIEREHNDAGGKGVNVSRVLTALGVRNTAFAITGEENLALFTRLLRREKVDFCPVRNLGKIRENMTIKLPDGKQVKINRKGGEVSNALMNEIGRQILLRCDGDTLVVFGGSLPAGMTVDIFREFLRWIKGSGAKIALDCSQLNLKDYIQLEPYIIKPNEVELSAAVGRELKTPDEVVEAVRPLLGKVEHILVSLGERGLIRVTEKGYILGQPPRLDAVSTVGAGDTALAGYIAALYAGRSAEDCVKYAAACGTASVKLEGTGVITGEMAREVLGQTSCFVKG